MQVIYTSNNPGNESKAVIKGNLVAWSEYSMPNKSSSEKNKLFLYDIETATFKTIIENTEDYIVDILISNEKVFWIQSRFVDKVTKKSDVFSYNLETDKIVQLTKTENQESFMVSGGNWVFWVEWTKENAILTGFDAKANRQYRIENSDRIPTSFTTDGLKLVFASYSMSLKQCAIDMVDLTTVAENMQFTKTELLSNAGKPYNLFVKNNHLVWQWLETNPESAMLMSLNDKKQTKLFEGKNVCQSI